ncbi:hypothetical protein V1605_10560 [Enterobacter soli]|uniref:hypothetical protein n=1 Tax=Enterobacter soli TaxID=885040 RepID=UPI0037550984
MPAHQTQQNALYATQYPSDHSAMMQTDRSHHDRQAYAQPDKINVSQTKTALHRTRLRFLDHKIFSVLIFYKPDRQTAPVLEALRKTRTEKIEKNFSVFHFRGSLINFKTNVCFCLLRFICFFLLRYLIIF